MALHHDTYKEWLQLSMHEELNADDQQLLRNHLAGCSECQAEQEHMLKFFHLLTKTQRVEPSDALLKEARSELRAALRAEENRVSLWQWLGDAITVVSRPRIAFALGSVATLVIGLFAGYVIFSPPTAEMQVGSQQTSEALPINREAPQITNVQFIDSDAKDGDVEFTFDFVTPVRMKGSVDDPAVQKVLAHALLSEQNPGVRLRSVNAMARQAEDEKLPDDEIRLALMRAVQSDPNPGVRKEALNVLQKFPVDRTMMNTYLNVLAKDENAGIRVAAINGIEKARLEGHPVGQNAIDILKTRIASDDNNYVRARAMAVLQEIKQQ